MLCVCSARKSIKYSTLPFHLLHSLTLFFFFTIIVINSNNSFSMYTNFNITFSTTPDLQQHNHLGEYESVPQLNSSGGGGGGGNYNSCSSGCASYLGSPDRLMQRSISSHSLQKNDVPHHHPFSTLFAELLDQENGPVRRVYSTGDLDQVILRLQYHLPLKSTFNG